MRAGATSIKLAVIAWLGLCAWVCVTVWHGQNERLAERTHADLEALADDVMDDVDAQLMRYQYGLRGTRGAVLATYPALSLARFHSSAISRDLAREFPGALAFGFIRRLRTEADEADFLAHARGERSPDFRIRTLVERWRERYVIEYVEPEATNAVAIGVDVASESNRREAAQRAARTGEPTLTGPVRLVQPVPGSENGLLLFLPVYSTGATPTTEHERERTSIGWTYVPLVLHTVLDCSSGRCEDYTIRIDDVTDGRSDLAYRSEGFDPATPRARVTERRVDMLGRAWRVQLHASESFVQRERGIHPTARAAWATLTAALFGLCVAAGVLYARRRGTMRLERDRLAAIVDHTSDAVLAKNLDGTITSWNRAAALLLGYHANEVIGRGIDVLTPEPPLHPVKERVLRTGVSALVESSLRTKHGDRVDISATVSPVYDALGKPLGVSIIARDVGARKAAETALRASEQRFRDLAQSIPLLVWTSTGQGAFDYLSPQWLAYTGKDEEPQLGAGWFAQVHPDERLRLIECWTRVVKTGEEFAHQFRLRRHDGVYRWFQTRALPIRDPAGRIIKWFGSATDIQDLRDAQSSLAALNDQLEQRVAARTHDLSAAEAFQRGLLSAAGSAIIATDLEGTITVWNQAAERLLGYAAEEVVGRSTPLLIHDAGEAATRYVSLEAELGPVSSSFEVFVARARRGEVEAREWTYIRKDGSRVPVLLTMSGLRDESGKLHGFLGVAVDLTAQRRAAEKLAELNRLLAERTAQAESASRAKSSFVASMSHEIRTPMNAILGATYLLGRTELGTEQRDLLATVQTASKGLLGMLNDILDLSKIEAGQLSLYEAPFRLRSLIADVVAMMGGLASEKGLALNVSIDQEVVDERIGDRTRLSQILVNLLSNAIKFTARGTVTLHVARTADDADEALRFSVRDTGMGMPEDALPRLFTPFFQVRDGAAGGTGLGLAIVRHLSTLMGGTVTVESSLGLGSCFCAALPLRRDPATLENEPHLPVAHPVGARLAGLSVLVVDDHEINLRVARALLEAEGARVVTAKSGGAAVARVRELPEPFDVILMDIQMPGMNGVEATQAIREVPACRAVPVIAVTAGALEDERRAAMAAGMDGFLIKPVDPEALIALLGGHGPRRNPEDLPQSAPAGEFRPLDGIDVEDARARFRGDFASYCVLLRMLLEEAQTDAPSPPHGLPAVAQRMHRLRGTAGNLGARELAERAARVEQAARAQDPEGVRVGLEELSSALTRISHALDQVSGHKPSIPAVSLDAGALRDLDTLLRANDLGALPLYRRLEAGFDAALSPTDARTLQRAIDLLDFATASVLVQSAEARAGREQPKL